MRTLVTGGAGFIGSHLVDGLLARGHDVLVYDNLDEQVHGSRNEPPAYLSSEAVFVRGDVRDVDRLSELIRKNQTEAIFHEAAAVGVGQSMYEPRRYVDVNCVGTASLLEAVAKSGQELEKVLVASSMSAYGEGAYVCPKHGDMEVDLRSPQQLSQREWEMRCPSCSTCMAPVPTSENKRLTPTSVYATTKRDQEELVLECGAAFRIPAVALRYFNVYGPRQSLSNPYTGVIAIFLSRLINGKPPTLFEDGLQARDFVHVSDVVEANLLALETDLGSQAVLNVGRGEALTVRDVATTLAEALEVDIPAEIPNRYRVGDIRHCFADVTKTNRLLGFNASVDFRSGIRDYVHIARGSEALDRTETAMGQLLARGLLLGDN